MKKIKSIMWLLAIASGLGIAILGVPQTAGAQTDKDNKRVEREDDDNDEDEKLSPDDQKRVKVSMKEAREIALKRISGKVIDEELEKENGRLQYAFDIRDADGKMFDVEIDAVTGDVLQAEEDDDDDNARTKSKVVKKKIFVRTATVAKTKP